MKYEANTSGITYPIFIESIVINRKNVHPNITVENPRQMMDLINDCTDYYKLSCNGYILSYEDNNNSEVDIWFNGYTRIKFNAVSPAPAEDDKEYREVCEEILGLIDKKRKTLQRMVNDYQSLSIDTTQYSLYLSSYTRLIADIKKGLEQGEAFNFSKIAESVKTEIAQETTESIDSHFDSGRNYTDADMVEFGIWLHKNHVRIIGTNPQVWQSNEDGLTYPTADRLTAWHQQKKGGGK